MLVKTQNNLKGQSLRSTSEYIQICMSTYIWHTCAHIFKLMIKIIFKDRNIFSLNNKHSFFIHHVRYTNSFHVISSGSPFKFFFKFFFSQQQRLNLCLTHASQVFYHYAMAPIPYKFIQNRKIKIRIRNSTMLNNSS